MANTNLTASIIAAEALRILDNNLVMSKLVYRGYESDFDKKVNGYAVGSTINVRRPTDYTVRDGRTTSIQDVTEGQFPIVVDKQKGVDFQFTSQELTLTIPELSERAIKPAMVQLANQIDRDLTGLYSLAYHWAGTAGQTIDSFADFAKGAERLDLQAAPQDDRAALLGPTDYWGIAGAASALYMQKVAEDAYRRGKIGDLGGVDTWMSQNVASHLRGTASTSTINVTATFSTTYAATLNSNTQTLALQFATSQSIAVGDVFTIGDVFAVNPVTKATQSYLQQFVVTAAAGGTATVSVVITPPLIGSGAFQTVSAIPTASSVVTFKGTASTVYPQNLMFHKNAIALVMVPMVRPPGSVDCSRQSYKGTSVRLIPGYTHRDDISVWRLDVLYGVKMLDPRLAVRLSGT